MPTYQNRSGQLVTVGDWSFSPGEKKPVHQYINVTDHPEIVKIDDLPPISNPFFILFPNIGGPSNMSRMFHGRISLVLGVRDGTIGGQDNDIVEVTAFAGITDKVSEMLPVKTFKFTRKTWKDEAGNATSYWIPEKDFRLAQQLVDSNYEIIAFQVTSFTGSGNINVLIKSY